LIDWLIDWFNFFLYWPEIKYGCLQMSPSTIVFPL
jgi:hypothetical protein